jgi:hypothetical protein
MSVTVAGQTMTVNYAQVVLPNGALDIDPALGFFSRAGSKGMRWKVANWLPLDLTMCIYSAERVAYRYQNATGWTQIEPRDVWKYTIPGMFSYNRFSGEVFGAVTESEVVPLQGKRLLSSEEITVTETPTGYKLSLAGPVKASLDLGDNDLTMNID